ncbi:hypothetical protein SAMN02745146_0620 [Hymenobacter daecheongensis DSM 21074]|uniref:MG2 domain-containing protein n=1 Tax=Hymenobacter daecheongensis DSM 21074 TaxID=1121955 RepID=A0A1M6AFJ2_9BACT|nr:hypothetical protein [Hymenobacter daecheongensis]SHI35229.1 hypothetical protein SAMN02745146_0620 [Hymenobacter daecheongensis DSM 21074]
MRPYSKLYAGGTRLLVLVLPLWLTLAGTAAGQTADSLSSLRRRLDRYQQTAPTEKLFLHLDRPLYLSGETMWFKVYAVDGTHARPLPLSTVAYVEVLDKEQRPVLQGKIPLRQATGQGSFVLPTALPSGAYTVRAYTSWMKNFAPDYYFHSTVTVVNTFTASGTATSKDSAAYAVEFFPEGGHLVQGLSSQVAFKVTDRAGVGMAAEGRVLDQQGNVAGTFQTLRFGMGSFRFTPKAGNTYTAVVALGRKPVLRHKLPAAQPQGYVLHLDDQATQVLLTVTSTSLQPETVFLLAHARQHAATALQAQLINGHAVFSLSKSQLAEGISHFTLFNAARQPLCERLYFQRPQAALSIVAALDKKQYVSRDRVSVQLATTSIAGTPAPEPLAASLSMAVYRLDSLTTAPTPDILSYLWLQADLKGHVENPAYYLTPDPAAAAAADNLMLTQGWSRFRWEQVFAPTPFEYLPELNGPLLRARLTQPGTGRPLPGITTYLTSPSRIIRLNPATSTANGLLYFELGDVSGSHDLVVQTDPKQDTTGRVELLSAFSTRFAPTAGTYTAPAIRFRSDITRRHFQAQVQKLYSGKFTNHYRVPAADSTAFYGKPDEVYLLDKYTRFKVLEEVMREYVPGVVVRIHKDGFHFLVLDKVNKTVLSENPMVLLDGVPIFNLNKMMAMDPLKIQKLEVVDSRYFHGPSIYDGIVSYTTYKGDLEGFPLDPRVLVQQYEGLQHQREFYAPRYDTPAQQQSRLPDLRNLLYWNPNLATTGAGAAKLDFYTGDQAGRYLVLVQGLAANGLAGSTSVILEVKPTL